MLEPRARSLFFLTWLLAGACAPVKPQYVGLTCDGTSECPAPLFCVAGHCSQSPSSPDGGFILADDAERPGLLLPDGGEYQVNTVTHSVEVALVKDAAHRGSAGIRFTDSNDADTGALRFFILDWGQSSSDRYSRAWVKVQANVAQDNVHIFQIGGGGSAIADLAVGKDVVFSGMDSAVGYSYDVVDTTLMDGAWHLVEMSVTGAGATTANRSLFVDGVSVSSKNVDLHSGGLIPEITSFGFPWSDYPTFMGSVDFDDVRAGTTPPAARLTLTEVTAGAEASGTGCLQFRVSLEDSFQQKPAPAPYDLAFYPVIGGGTATLHGDDTCTTQIHGVSVARGATGTDFFLQRVGTAEVDVSVSAVDFLVPDTVKLPAR